MAGEQLQTARLTPLGLDGDRIVHVKNKLGRTVTARTHPSLLGLKATLGKSADPLVNGRPWTDPKVLEAVQNIVGPGARLVRDESLDRFDILPLLVATDGAIAEFGRDRRRLRPNLVIGDVVGLAEREWQESQLLIDEVVIVTTTFGAGAL